MPKRKRQSSSSSESDEPKRDENVRKRIQPRRKCSTPHKPGKQNVSEPSTSRQNEVAEKKNEVNQSNFDLLKVLGRGGYGKVYLARKKNGIDGRKLYAMKVIEKAALRPNGRIAMKVEFNILVELNLLNPHPYIVRLNYAFQTSAKLFLIFDFAHGGDMRDYVFDEKATKFYIAVLVTALDYLHSLGIIYRDLKPENVVLNQLGHAMLTDFGLAKKMENNAKSAMHVCCGTGYIAPEVLNGKARSSYASDWWSLGIVMFQMLFGVLPFVGKHVVRKMAQVLDAMPDANSVISSEGQSLLKALCELNPKNRLGVQGPNLIYHHPFFASIDFDALLKKKIEPPFKPNIHNDDYYNSIPALENLPEGRPADAAVNNYFKGYKYTASHLRLSSSDSDSDDDDEH